MAKAASRKRCAWVNDDPLYRDYHDHEWGVPVRDSKALFEMLCLEGAQAGLSWYTILKKREHYRTVYDHFDPVKMAAYGAAKQRRLLNDPGIVRNRLKVAAFVSNAQQFVAFETEHGSGSFATFLWAFVDGEPLINRPRELSDVPASTPRSDSMSKALKKRGFKFVGSTICYAFMQACGMVNDHGRDCFRCPPKPSAVKGSRRQHRR